CRACVNHAASSGSSSGCVDVVVDRQIHQNLIWKRVDETASAVYRCEMKHELAFRQFLQCSRPVGEVKLENVAFVETCEVFFSTAAEVIDDDNFRAKVE